MTTIPSVTLNDGTSIPQLGYGTHLVPPEETAAAVQAALEAGYRHIDTAQMYFNERGVGEGIRAAGLNREEVYVTSKLSNAMHRPGDARRAMEGTLAELGTDYVDLFLIHWPLPTLYDGDFVTTWRTLEEFTREGRARSVGVSNFEISHLERLADHADMLPAVNQIEVHPYMPNDGVRTYDRLQGIATQAWSPLAKGAALVDPVITGVADRLGRTPSQVVVRWHIQRGDIVFPKTMSPERMRENIDVFDFELSTEHLKAISKLDKGEAGRIGPHPDTFDWIPS